MLVIKHLTVVAAFVGAAIAADPPPTAGGTAGAAAAAAPPACTVGDVKSLKADTSVRLLCNDQGKAPAGAPTGAKLYSCKPQDKTSKLEADFVTVKSTTADSQQVSSITLSNTGADSSAHKLFVITGASTSKDKTTFYYELDGAQSCSVAAEDIQKIGGFDPTGVSVSDSTATTKVGP